MELDTPCGSGKDASLIGHLHRKHHHPHPGSEGPVSQSRNLWPSALRISGTLQRQGELSATPDGTNWFPDKYLSAIKTACDAYGKPLVDVYDFHSYPEIYDANGTRILDLTGTTLTDAQVQLIVQGPETCGTRRSTTTTIAIRGSSRNWATIPSESCLDCRLRSIRNSRA
jgi:hypothetical protein